MLESIASVHSYIALVINKEKNVEVGSTGLLTYFQLPRVIFIGEEQGVCVCDRPDCKCECQCKSGWKNTIFNPTCECSTDTSGCMESVSTVLILLLYGIVEMSYSAHTTDSQAKIDFFKQISYLLALWETISWTFSQWSLVSCCIHSCCT